MGETEPAWLVAAVDQRIALLKQDLGVAEQIREHGITVVMTPLTEPPSDEQALAWERTCDSCGVYCPGKFYTGVSQRTVLGVQVVVTYGACPRCAGKVSG